MTTDATASSGYGDVTTIARIPEGEAGNRNLFNGVNDYRYYTILYGCDLCWQAFDTAKYAIQSTQQYLYDEALEYTDGYTLET